MKLVINIGHGGKDPGAVNNELGITENQFNRQLGVAIKQLWPYYVRLIEQDDSGLNQLVRDINTMEPDLVVSLHCNAAEAKTATGTETLYWHTSTEGKRLAEYVQARMVKALGLADRGVKPRDNLAILRGTKCPAIIVEPFFISNGADYKKVDIDALAKAILMGVSDYVGNVDTSAGKPAGQANTGSTSSSGSKAKTD